MENIKISVVQFSYKPIEKIKDFESNIKQLINKTDGSDFVVFPENFTFELMYLDQRNGINGVLKFTNDYIELFTELAKKKNQYIIAGSHPTEENNRIYNVGYIFCPDGQHFKHNKTHLHPLESKWVSPGNSIKIFNTKKAKIGLAICYEIEFPELVRKLTLMGAEIIFCPSYTVGEHGFWRVRHCCQARAIENQIYVVHSCFVGTPLNKAMSGWGRASILSPCESPWPPNGIIAE
ncbi:MAG TPA: nitrilase-related carbon-nitrogen hydrolase, partial [Candidatus Lokiarchaeia archaeon]